MNAFTPRIVALAVVAALGAAAALPASAGPLTSVKSLDGSIDFAATQFDDVLPVQSDSSTTLISNSFTSPGSPFSTTASYIGDTANGRLGVNVDVANGNYAASHASYTEVVTNTTDHDLDLSFSFYIKPGQVQFVGTPSPDSAFWEGSAALRGAIVWDTIDNIEFSDPIWGFSASAFGDSLTGVGLDANTDNAPGFKLNAGDNGFTYDAYQYTLSLGKLGAGQTRELGYFLDAEGFYNEAFCGCTTVTRFSALVEGPVGGHVSVGAFDPSGIGGTPGVQYLAVAAVPEPQTWAMLGVGLLVAAGAARRRGQLSLRTRAAA